MVHVSLDTSFLISFADPRRPHHKVAVDYFKHCIAVKFPMWISTVAAGEFQVGQAFTDLPLQNFRIQPYNLTHALRAGDLFKLLSSEISTPRTDPRKIIINDLKIIAQAIEDKLSIILSEDEGTLAKFSQRIQRSVPESPHVLLLSHGFTPGRLIKPEQDEIPLSPSS
jgi:hypothetical protein